MSVQVLDHANPSLSFPGDANVATINFGIKGKGLGAGTSAFSIFNLPTTVSGASTARLDLDSIAGTGDTARLTTNATTFINHAAGAAGKNFIATISDTSNGSFSASYTFDLSDENLSGATSVGTLVLNLTGIIATPGDADLNGVIDFDDFVLTDGGYNGGLSGWGNGDFDGNGAVDFDDYVLLDLNFNMQGGGGAALLRAQNYITGEDRSERGMNTPGLQLVELHFRQLGNDYASAFVTAVPEPGGLLIPLAVSFWAGRARRRR